MPTKYIEVAPQGDTLIILPEQNERHDCERTTLSSPMTPKDKTSDSPSKIHLRVSKSHLSLASRRARAMFEGGFKESVPDETDGLYHWDFEQIFDPAAFEMVVKIIHGKTRDLPETVSTEMLAGISAVVDDLECHDATWFIGRQWLRHLESPAPFLVGEAIARWILISSVFQNLEMFQRSPKAAIQCGSASLLTYDLPIYPDIVDQVDSRRQSILKKLIDGLFKLRDKLLNDKIGCNPGCRSVLLGALIRAMDANSLYSPRPSKPFAGIHLSWIIGQLRMAQSTSYFCPAENILDQHHSGCWKLERYPVVDRSLDQESKAQIMFGGQKIDEKVPQRLALHRCSLKNQLRPLLDAIEAEIEGLDLSKFPLS